jgi:hypothetical protein
MAEQIVAWIAASIAAWFATWSPFGLCLKFGGDLAGGTDVSRLISAAAHSRPAIGWRKSN